jgi:hypothetical protein
MAFPTNPENGTVFEDAAGIFYQYSDSTKSWYKIAAPNIPLATIFNDGLMSSDDFTKLTGILVPPPEISLTFEDCEDSVFDKGLLVLTGDSDGIIDIDVSSSKLHENTAVVNFKLDAQKFARKLTNLGTLRLATPQGEQGDQGAQGDAGADALPVGPQGEDGADGANAPWPGGISEEIFSVAQQDKAVVDIETRSVSADENYLIIYRANIGDPEACPNTIIPQDIQSPWLLAFDTDGNVSYTQTISPATGAVCGWACHSSLFYFDAEVIQQSIYTQWVNYLNSVKAQKEALANEWLTALITSFNIQKAALCCALEACRSRTRNVQTRQYIEQQRVQAALGGFQVVVGAEEDKDWPPMDRDGDCTWNIAPTNANVTYLSDPDCKIDWEVLCPTAIDHSWRPWSDLIGSVFSAAAPIDVPDVLVSAGSASGTYSDGLYVENDDSLQWAWHYGNWILMVWKCKADNRFAARLYDSSSNGTRDYGGSQNATSCFMAGDLINIDAIESGAVFTISGSNILAGSVATVRVL